MAAETPNDPPATSDPNTSNQLSIRFDTRKMLALVRDNKHMWQVTHPDYYNTQLRQEVWYDIARRLDSNFELLQETDQKRGVFALIKRWKSARDGFFHSLRCKRPYVYENELKFVLEAYGAWQCVPIKTESLSEDGVAANASDSEQRQSRAYGDTVTEHHSAAYDVKIKDENSEELDTDDKAMPTPPQTAVDDAAEGVESSSNPRKRKRMKSSCFDKEETLQNSMDNDTEIHRGEKQTTSDDRATPERRSADYSPEVHQSRKKKKKKSRNSEMEAPPLSSVDDTGKVGKAHKKKKNKATNGFESVATLKKAVDEAAAEIYLQEPRKIRKKKHTNSDAEATLQSDSVSDTAGADQMCNSRGMKVRDFGQAFFNKIKPTVRMLDEDQKLIFRIEVIQLLKEIRIRRNSNSTQNSSFYD